MVHLWDLWNSRERAGVTYVKIICIPLRSFLIHCWIYRQRVNSFLWRRNLLLRVRYAVRSSIRRCVRCIQTGSSQRIVVILHSAAPGRVFCIVLCNICPSCHRKRVVWRHLHAHVRNIIIERQVLIRECPCSFPRRHRRIFEASREVYGDPADGKVFGMRMCSILCSNRNPQW